MKKLVPLTVMLAVPLLAASSSLGEDAAQQQTAEAVEAAKPTLTFYYYEK